MALEENTGQREIVGHWHLDVSQSATASSGWSPNRPFKNCRLDNITTLRTGKKEIWNKIYFPQEKVPCKFIFNILLQIW